MSAFNQDGKVVAVNDEVTITGNVVSVSGTGPTAMVTVETVLSANNFVAQANDMNAVQSEGSPAVSISGKHFGTAEDKVSVLGVVTAISGSGNTASLTVTLKTSGLSVTVPAGACRSAQFNG
jgi:hypothetical protein